MTMIHQKYLEGGPDILHFGSKTHKKVGANGVIFKSAFIFTKFGENRLIVAGPNEAHIHITEKPETVRAMFGPEYNKYQEIADNIYYDGPSIRTMAQQLGNMFGRSGWVQGVPVIMLWNYNQNKDDLALLAKALEFDPCSTVVVNLHEELGLVKDLI
jgi:hypothetical protein